MTCLSERRQRDTRVRAAQDDGWEQCEVVSHCIDEGARVRWVNERGRGCRSDVPIHWMPTHRAA